MKKLTSLYFLTLRNITTLIFTLMLAAPTLLSAQPLTPPGDMMGLAYVGHHVSNLERSIEFYEQLDFHLVGQVRDWTENTELNRLGNTPGAESRTAIMSVQSSVSDVPFTLILRQYRGIERQDWSQLTSYNLLSSHIDLTVSGSVSPLLDNLEALDMLTMPKVQGLSNERDYEGYRRYAFIQDPDGLVIEYFGKPIPEPGAPPAAPTVSNSTATDANIERFGIQPGFNHYATNIINPETARDFYVHVLGGDYASLDEHEADADMIMLHGWFPQAPTNKNLRVELVWFDFNSTQTPPPKQFADINTSHAGFQVSNIDTAYARAKAYGATTITEGGIMDVSNGRAVLIRDPDVGGYIVLWEEED